MSQFLKNAKVTHSLEKEIRLSHMLDIFQIC